MNIRQNQFDHSICNSNEDDDDEDDFYTPPSSPSVLDIESESADEFNDTELPKYDVFIEG